MVSTSIKVSVPSVNVVTVSVPSRFSMTSMSAARSANTAVSLPSPPLRMSSPRPPLRVSSPASPFSVSFPPLPLSTLAPELPDKTSSPAFEPEMFSKLATVSASAPLMTTVPLPASSRSSVVPTGVAVSNKVSIPSPPSAKSFPPKVWMESLPAPPKISLISLLPSSVSSKSVPTMFSKSVRVKRSAPST